MSDDFRPTANWDRIRLRAELLKRTREFFDSRDLLEVETPLLSAETVVDRHLHPPKFELAGLPCYLQTSPEAAMKRLLADAAIVGNAARRGIYQITRSFRGEEVGQLHNPEFTIVEWYRSGDTYQQGMDLLAELAIVLLKTESTERISYADAFDKYVGICPHTTTGPELFDFAKSLNIESADLFDPADRDSLLDLLLVERIQPHLGRERPTILYDYPASQAALAETRREDHYEVAERFELYSAGIELANGYNELRDAAELRRRIARANEERTADGRTPLPEPTRLLTAMESGFPPTVGCALGFDRVVMLAAGATNIKDVISFPFDRA